MIPSIDARLDSMARALQEAILPSLGDEQSLAIEQARLVLGQIAIIRQQLDLAPAFERNEAEAMVALARELLADGRGGAETTKAAQALQDAVSATVWDSPAAIRSVTGSVGRAIEALIVAASVDGDAAFKDASFDHVITAGRRAALLERSWNRASGFETADANIPEIAGLLTP